MECLFLNWRRPKHHRKLRAIRIHRSELIALYFEEFTMSLAQLRWTLPAEDVADATGVDIFDGAVQVGHVEPTVGEFATGELEPGDHVLTVVVRSRAGASFDSDASNAAPVTVPVPSVKLTAVSDLAAVLA